MDNIRLVYYLDSKIRSGTTVTMKVTSNKSSLKDKGYVVGAELKEFTLKTANYNYSEYSAYLYLEDAFGELGEEKYGKIYYNMGKIELYFDFPPVSEGQDNIKVEFESADIPYYLNLEMEHAGVFFFKGQKSGNEFLCFSEINDKLYVPANNYVDIDYTALIPLSDSTVGAFTKSGINFLTRTEETIGSDLKYIYRNYIGAQGEVAIAKNSIGVLVNEPLFLSENGVYSLKLSENIKSNERYAIERSSLINSKLTKHQNLSSAKSIVWKNKYYLSIDNKVYIADARYKKSARDSDMDDAYNYEWWVWEDVPVTKWIILNDKLYFIDDNNKLCEFNDVREDRTLIRASMGSSSAGYFAPITTSPYYYQFDLTKKELLKENNLIKAVTPNETKVYVIKNIDLTRGTFCLQIYGDESDQYIYNNEPIFGQDSKGYYYSVYIIDRRNVVSEWYTPVINMGTDLYSKNLLTSTLVFEPSTEGEVKYGYLTRRKSETTYKDSALTPTNGLDLENLDFNDFSFSPGFAASRTLKTKVRNFNYIQFRIVSDNNKDSALNHFTVTYNIGRKNKGVR